jgi:hypothetical protein
VLTRFTGTPENKAALVTTVPMGRLGLSEELGNAIVFIASDEASFITGHVSMAVRPTEVVGSAVIPAPASSPPLGPKNARASQASGGAMGARVAAIVMAGAARDVRGGELPGGGLGPADQEGPSG